MTPPTSGGLGREELRERLAAVCGHHRPRPIMRMKYGIWGIDCGCGWSGPADDFDGHLADALLASGVLDAVRGEAWDEGYRSGLSNAMRRMSDEPDAPTTPNPYRAALGERGER